ncbi:MAG: winged helix-turn-helix domain-containing protein [Elusimicrobia bacterium]|nr:winged helix-turn-helix domain-containing protein [Elusimicrobiota bacterium]
MWDEIGQTAGQVWTFLEARGESSSLHIRSSLKISQTLLCLSLGWLAREGKIDIIYRDRSYWVLPRR